MAETPTTTPPSPKPKSPAPAAAAATRGSGAEAMMRQEIRRSNVRVYVTYSVTFTYCLVAAGLILWLMKLGKVDLALGTFSGLSAVATGIIGFWFGGRRSAPQSGG